jgi:hypothetical protein
MESMSALGKKTAASLRRECLKGRSCRPFCVQIKVALGPQNYRLLYRGYDSRQRAAATGIFTRTTYQDVHYRPALAARKFARTLWCPLNCGRERAIGTPVNKERVANELFDELPEQVKLNDTKLFCGGG